MCVWLQNPAIIPLFRSRVALTENRQNRQNLAHPLAPCHNILAKDIRKFYSSKLALSVILFINDYNYNINKINLAN